MMGRRKALALACALGLASGLGTAHAAGRPDFSGTWKLDTLRSEFGQIPGGRPRARVDVIQHREPRIRQTLFIDNWSRQDTTVYLYTSDGKPTVNRVGSQDIRSTVWWEGRILRLESKTRLLIYDMTLKERWILSADGKVLTMARRVKYPLGEGEQKLVFRKR